MSRYEPVRWWEWLLVIAAAGALVYLLSGRLREPPCEFRGDRWNRAGCTTPPPSRGGIP